MSTVTEALLDLPARAGSQPALLCPDDGAVVTHEQLLDAALLLASRLRGAGVDRGDRVALVLPNGPEIVELLFALAVLGAVAAPLNPAYTEAEYRFYLDDLTPRLMLAGAGGARAGPTAAEAAGIPVADVVATGADGRPPTLRLGGREVRSAAMDDRGGPDDVVLLLHTSGTTSRPKQVPLLQRNLTSQARSIARHYRLDASDVSYCAMPLFHVHGLVASALAQIAAGGSVIVPRRLSPSRFWSQAALHAVTWLSAGPTLHRMILQREGSPPGSLRFVRSCSSALPVELMQEGEDRYGVPMVEAYGMTEAGHQITSNPLPPEPRRAGSVGVPAGAEIRVVDRAGEDVAAGSPGEVAIRGPGVTPGYLENPEANAEAFFDGWFRTGDEGVLEDGYLRLRGRLKEMIIRGGENISPYEIEEVLLSHPSVAEAIVFGVDDVKYGQTVSGAVVLRDAATTPEDLRRHARQSLAAFKVPDRIHVLDQIPKTPTGKVQRRRMAADLASDAR